MAMGNLSASAQKILLFLLLLVTIVVADNVPSLKGEAENRVPNEGGQGDGNAKADVNENNESYSDSNDDIINDDCVSSYSDDGDTGSGYEYTDTWSEYNSDDYYTDSGSESDSDDSDVTDSGSESDDDDDSSDAMDDEDVDIVDEEDEEDGRYYKIL